MQFQGQYSLLLQYEILEKLVTYSTNVNSRLGQTSNIKLLLQAKASMMNVSKKKRITHSGMWENWAQNYDFLKVKNRAGIPNAFRIPMVAFSSVFQWCFVLNKIAAILSETIGNLNKMVAYFFLDIQWFVFAMVGTIAISIAITDHWKSKLQNVRYSNVFGIPMFSYLAPTTVLKCQLCAKKIVIW